MASIGVNRRRDRRREGTDAVRRHRSASRSGGPASAVTRLGFGGASIGGLFAAVDDDAAIDDRRARVGPRHPARSTWRRCTATAPRSGASGAALAERPRDATSSRPRSAGWSAPPTAIPPGADIDRQALDGREDAFYVGTEPVRMVFDYSADGVRRSIEESLERLGLDRIDIALIHDPDDHWEAAIDEA